jgi:hypothetical protein
MSFVPPSLTINTIGYVQLTVSNAQPTVAVLGFYQTNGATQNVESFGEWTLDFYQSKTNTNAMFSTTGTATNYQVAFNVTANIDPTQLTFQVKSNNTPRAYGTVLVLPSPS